MIDTVFGFLPQFWREIFFIACCSGGGGNAFGEVGARTKGSKYIVDTMVRQCRLTSG